MDLLPGTSTIPAFDFADPQINYVEHFEDDDTFEVRGRGNVLGAISRLRLGRSQVFAHFATADGAREVLVDQPEEWLWSTLSSEQQISNVKDQWLAVEYEATATARADWLARDSTSRGRHRRIDTNLREAVRILALTSPTEREEAMGKYYEPSEAVVTRAHPDPDAPIRKIVL